MNEEPEEVLKRHGVSKPGITNQKKSTEEMAKALVGLEHEVDNLRRYSRSLESRVKKSEADLVRIKEDNYGGLEKIPHWDEAKKDKYFIGVKSRHENEAEKEELYFKGNSLEDRENKEDLNRLKKDKETLCHKLEELKKDNEKKKKERDRAFSRAVSAEKKLENFLALQGFYVGGDCHRTPLPFKIEAEDRCVAEIRADHGKIMVCKNKNSSWFFRFGGVYVEGVCLSQTNTKGIEIKPGDRFKVMWSTEHDMYEECYYLEKDH